MSNAPLASKPRHPFAFVVGVLAMAGACASNPSEGAGGTAGAASNGAGGGDHPGGGGAPSSLGGSGQGGGAGTTTGAGGALATGGNGPNSGGASAGNGGQPASGALPALHVDGKFIKDAAGNTVILRGVDVVDLALLDTSRAPMNIAKLLDLISDGSQGWYARAVRMTVAPLTWQNNPDDYFNKYLKPAVDHATQRNLYAIIDWHYIADPAANAAATMDFWNYVAPRFAGQSNVLYELYNEPIKINGAAQWDDWKTLAQPWVDAIRAKAPNNLILIGGPQWSQIIGGSATNPFSGSNLVYVGHVYPEVATALWAANGEITRAAAAHPVFITEWGYIQGGAPPTSGTQTGFGDPFKAFLEASGVSWTAWCADTSWDPKMFNSDWTPKSGDNYMGQFIKDFLTQKH